MNNTSRSRSLGLLLLLTLAVLGVRRAAAGGTDAKATAAKDTDAKATDAKANDENAEGMVSLFNGKDLIGWKPIGTAVWKVEDGVIVGGQDGDPKRAGVLATEKEYKDFDLTLDFMIDEHGKYNSGVYIRNEPGKAGQTGYQINIGRAEVGEYTGGIYAGKWLAKGDEKDEVRKPREWNTLRIKAEGGHVTVHLNGKLVADYTDPHPEERFVRPGVIALQTYGAEGHAGWVKFRNIKIREIK